MIDDKTIRELGMGAAILSTGGGSFPYLEVLAAHDVLKAGGPVPLIEASSLADEANVALVAMTGAPLPMFERFVDVDHFARPVKVLERHYGLRFDAIMGYEIGSMNGIIPCMIASSLGLPLVDSDTVGRSFPQMNMSNFALTGAPMTPMCMSDIRDNDVIIAEAVSGAWLEAIQRPITTSYGSLAAVATASTGAIVKAHAIHGTYSRAIRVGAGVLARQARHEDPVAALVEEEGGLLLTRGRVVDIERHVTGGFVRGVATIADALDGALLKVDFQNEYSVVTDEAGVVVTVPDLICVFDAIRGEPIGTEALRYAQQVAVVYLPTSPAHLRPEVLPVLGPRGFGYPFDYRAPRPAQRRPA
jgi:DUF917 family protein